MTGVLIQRGEDTQRRSPGKDGGRDWLYIVASQGMPRTARGHQKLGGS